MGNIESFNIPYENLRVEASAILNFLGYVSTTPPPQVALEVDEILPLIPGLARPQGGYILLEDSEVEIKENSFSVRDKNFETGEVIASQLKNSSTLAFLVATAGPNLPEKSNELIKKGEYLKGYIVDAAGSLIAENAAEFTEMRMVQIISQNCLKTSQRLSPGYCGWDVSEQQKLFSFLPDGFAGVTLTESSLMIPIKSISAVVGIGKNVVKGKYMCELCDMENCFRRRF